MADDEGDALDAREQFAVLVPAVGGLLTVLVVVLDGPAAASAGAAVGVGVVVLAGVLARSERRGSDADG